MFDAATETFTRRRLPQGNRPEHMPPWGGHWLGDDLAQRSGLAGSDSEPIYAVGVTAFQYIMGLRAPWDCFDVPVFTGFLLQHPDVMSPERVREIIGEVDLLADYLCCCGEINAEARDHIVATAEDVTADITRIINGKNAA